MITIHNFTKYRKNLTILSALNWAGFNADISMQRNLMKITHVDMIQDLACMFYGSEVSAAWIRL